MLLLIEDRMLAARYITVFCCLAVEKTTLLVLTEDRMLLARYITVFCCLTVELDTVDDVD